MQSKICLKYPPYLRADAKQFFVKQFTTGKINSSKRKAKSQFVAQDYSTPSLLPQTLIIITCFLYSGYYLFFCFEITNSYHVITV